MRILQALVVAAAFLMAAPSAHAHPQESGKKYASFCQEWVDKVESTGQVWCVGFYAGVVRGYPIAFSDGLAYPMTIDERAEAGDMEYFRKFGEAVNNGRANGYCSPKDTTVGDGVGVAISTILATPELHDIPAHTALIKALKQAWPCKR